MPAIELSDFTKGIYSSYVSAASPAMDGAAQLDGTFGCVGLPFGGLGPGPRIVNTFRQHYAEGAQPFTGMEYAGVMMMRTLSAFYPSQNTNLANSGGELVNLKQEIYGSPDYPDFIWAGLSWVETNTNGTLYTYHYRVTGYKFFLDSTYSAVIVDSAGRVDTGGAIANAPRYIPGIYADFGRSTSPVTTYVTPQLALWDAGSLSVKLYPDLVTNTLTGDSYARSELTSGSGILAHQDRLLSLGAGDALGTTAKMLNAEAIYYSTQSQWDDQQNSTGFFAVAENPSSFGVWTSMNANEVFIVKQFGGGLVIRGDIANPTVIRLPGIPSTQGVRNIGTATPLGFVYGSKSAVWLWTGGDAALSISPQLDGWFWKADERLDVFYWLAYRGSFTYNYPYIVAPNNFIFDTRTNSWWRIGNPEQRTYCWNSNSATGKLVCSPAAITHEDPVLFDWYDCSLGAPYYKWKSQPLQRTRGRVLKFREMDVVLVGDGTITFTMQGIDGRTEQQVFTVNSSQPVNFSRKMSLKSHDVILSIESKARDMANDPAPTVLRFAAPYDEAESIA